jgi:putative transcriptional regulator
MSKAKKYKNDVKSAIHELASGLHDVGMIDKQTMRRFDESCLTPIHPFSAREIKALREREDVSQTVFASYLNVTKDSVSKWERGEKKPAGPSLKLLSLVERKGLESIA